MKLSYKFRAYPSKSTQKVLEEHLEVCRWLYNRLLEEIRKAKDSGKKVSKYDTQRLILGLKEEKPELRGVYSKVLQMVNYQLWGNIRALSRLKGNGKKVGRLRYKGRGWFKTINFNQSGFKIFYEKGIIEFSGVGRVKVRFHRIPGGKVKGVIIKREKSGRWFVILQCDGIALNPLPRTGKRISIDVGVENFVYDSQGFFFQPLKAMERFLRRIKLLQRSLSRKKKGSRNREKARIRVARVFERIENIRNDFLHKVSSWYVKNFDEIAVEDLDVKGLVEAGYGRALHRNIMDSGWGKFFMMLSYKAERAGRRLIRVSPRGTTNRCSRCESVVSKRLWDRVHRCPFCGVELPRDLNSALNIWRLAGWGPPEEPVERRAIPAELVLSGQLNSWKQEAPCVSWE